MNPNSLGCLGLGLFGLGFAWVWVHLGLGWLGLLDWVCLGLVRLGLGLGFGLIGSFVQCLVFLENVFGLFGCLTNRFKWQGAK